VPENIDASERMVGDWNRRIQETAQRYQAMADRVQELSLTERSQDGTIEVTINSKGLLTNLGIAERVNVKSMAQLSGQIMNTVQRAQSRLPELLQQAMAETVGMQDATANKVFEDAKKTFPEPPPEEPVSPPPPDRELSFGPADDDPPAPNPKPRSAPKPPPPAPPQPPQPPRPPQPPQSTQPPQPRRRGGDDDDDDDFGDQSILR
jgi:DNA-binding protein YbaB